MDFVKHSALMIHPVVRGLSHSSKKSTTLPLNMDVQSYSCQNQYSILSICAVDSFLTEDLSKEVDIRFSHRLRNKHNQCTTVTSNC